MKKYFIIISVSLLLCFLFITVGCASSLPDNANDSIGRKVNIDVYVNDIKIETLVYSNSSSPPVQGPDNLSDYVQLKPILEVLDIDLSATAEWHYLVGESVDIDGEIYVPFSTIRYNINGSLKQDNYDSMYLYSADYIREDIPATLEEAYKALDELLDPEDIEYIKNLAEDDIITMHFGLGLWIRNNWLYPTNSRLTKALLELNPNFSHPDDMSHFILTGYYYYLNGDKYTLDTYKQESQQANTKHFILYISLLFVFIFTVVAVIFFFRKSRTKKISNEDKMEKPTA